MDARTTPVAPRVTPGRRVRHEARDGLAVMAFSLATSLAVALLCHLLLGLGR